MSTEIARSNSFVIRQFFGGSEKGISIQITQLDNAPSYGYVQFTVDECRNLIAALTGWSNRFETVKPCTYKEPADGSAMHEVPFAYEPDKTVTEKFTVTIQTPESPDYCGCARCMNARRDASLSHCPKTAKNNRTTFLPTHPGLIHRGFYPMSTYPTTQTNASPTVLRLSKMRIVDL